MTQLPTCDRPGTTPCPYTALAGNTRCLTHVEPKTPVRFGGLIPLPAADPLEHARRQLGVTPLPAAFPPGPGVARTVAQHIEAFNTSAKAANAALAEVNAAITAAAPAILEKVAQVATPALPAREPAPPTRRGWLDRARDWTLGRSR